MHNPRPKDGVPDQENQTPGQGGCQPSSPSVLPKNIAEEQGQHRKEVQTRQGQRPSQDSPENDLPQRSSFSEGQRQHPHQHASDQDLRNCHAEYLYLDRKSTRLNSSNGS